MHPLPLPRGFLFDMDGTLIDNMPVHIQVWTQFMAELGVTIDPNRFHEQTAGKTNPEILRMYMGEHLTDEQVTRYSQEKEARYRRVYRDSVRPLPGLLEFLERAHREGIALALATSAGRENIDFTLELLGLTGAFQAVIGSEQVRHGKPDPEAFLLAAEGLGLPPAGCMVFEDSYKGIEAGHRAGMPVVAILTALSADQALSLPGVVHVARDYTGLNWFSNHGG